MRVRKGRITARWSSLVHPRTWFESRRTRLHGIDRKAVRGQPTIDRLYDRLRALDHSVVVHHGGEEPAALAAALNRDGLPALRGVRWPDSERVVRRAWPRQFALNGYGLENVASALGVSFRHHDAAEDAAAAAEVVLRACRDTAVDVHGWLSLVQRPADFGHGDRNSAPTPKGLLDGERVALTGNLRSIRRTATLSDLLGCAFTPDIDAGTTILVVGEAAPCGPGGHGKTAKLLAAEALVARGTKTRILSEEAFVALVERGCISPRHPHPQSENAARAVVPRGTSRREEGPSA